VDNPNLSRYVLPGVNGIAAPGKWNVYQPGGRSVSIHAFIGLGASGGVEVAETMPHTFRAWADGVNIDVIQFECCQNLADNEYGLAVYETAVEYTAYLCGLYGIRAEAPYILSHKEAHRLLGATNHGDIENWWPKFGKNMDTFRADVYQKLQENNTMTAKTGDSPSQWAQAATIWAKAEKLFAGDGSGNYDWQRPVTREETAQILRNFQKSILAEISKNALI
jgi:N-acetylmuramoyl-L-alanine amidase